MNSDVKNALALCKQANPAHQPRISRRGFLSLMTGTGLVLAGGQLAPGVCLEAVADEAGGVSLVLYVLSRKQVAISLKNVQDPSNPVALTGASITLNSYYTNTSLGTKTTDKKGAALFDIEKFSEPQDPAILDKVYQFWSKMVASAEGYRTYETGLVHITGATRIDAPTVPTQAGDAYLQCLTMDLYDIQYATGTWGTFLWAKKLDRPKNHGLSIKLNVGKGNTSTYTIGYNHGPREGNKPITSVKVTDKKTGLAADADGLVYVNFEDIYFCESGGHGKNFQLDGGLDVFFSQEGSAAGTSTCVTTFKLKEAVLSDDIDGEDVISTKALTMAGKDGGLDLSASLPDSVPILRNVKLNVWYPSLPVRFTFSPFGKLALGIGAGSSINCTDPTGQSGADQWQSTSEGSAKEQFDKKMDKFRDAYNKEKLRNGVRKANDKAFGKPTLDQKLQVKAALDALVELDWEEAKLPDGSIVKRWGGSIDFYLNLSASLSVTATTTIGPVPVFLVFELGAALGVDALIKASRPTTGVDSFAAVMEGTGFGIDLKYTVGLTLGVGIPGVLSGGARGTGYLRMYVGFVVPPENKSFPRGLIGAGFSIDLVFQVFIFKVNMTLLNEDYPKLEDSWKSSSATNNDSKVSPWQPMTQAYRIDDPNNADDDDGRIIDLVSVPGGGFGIRDSHGAASNTIDLNRYAVPVKNAELQGVCEQIGMPDASNSGKYVFSPTGEHFTDAICTNQLMSSGSVRQGERFLGAMPSCTKILASVFSDSRSKVVSTATGTYLFRIGSVQYGEGEDALVRSRVCIAEQASDGSWDDKGPLDLDFAATATTPGRIDVYDYDFDVVANAQLGRIYVVVIGGTRPTDIAESNLKLDDVAQSTIVMSVVLGTSFVRLRDPFVSFDYYNLNDSHRHTLLFPRAAIDVDNHVLCGFLHRRVSASASFFSGNAPLEDYPAFVMIDPSEGKFIVNPATSTYLYESSICNTDNKKDVQLHVVGQSFLGEEGGVAFSFVTFDQSALQIEDNEVNAATEARFMLLQPRAFEPAGVKVTQLGAVENVSVIRPWSKDGKSLAKKNSALVEISVDFDDSGNPLLIEGSDLMLDGFHIDCFDVSADGSTVFYTKVREGNDAGDISTEPESSGEVGPSIPVSENQVFAARKIRYGGGDKLISPYPLAQLATPPDQISIFGATATDATARFVYTTITNLNESKADIYYASVPLLKSLKLLDFHSENYYVVAGETEPLIITVQNTGNTVLSQFNLEILEGAKTVDTLVVKISPSITLASVDDVKLDNPLPAASLSAEDALTAAAVNDPTFTPCETVFDVPTESGVLVPGKTRSYKVNFTVPTAWGPLADEGTQEHTLSARILCDESLKLAGQEENANAAGFRESEAALASVNTLDAVGLTAEADSFTSGTVSLLVGEALEASTYLAPNYYHTENAPQEPTPPAKTGDGTALPATLATLGVALGVAGVVASKADSAD